MSTLSAAAPRRRFSKQDFHRYCRLVHGWLSAFAFLILCFFSLTGILLNHPEWIDAAAPEPREKEFTLEASELERLIDAQEPERLLPEIASRHMSLKGAYSSGNQVGNEIFVRLQGVRGLTDLRASLVTGQVAVVVEPAAPLAVLNELHRAERAGPAWRLLVDVIGGVLVVLSIIGYLIFLSLRVRLRTALMLTAASGVGLWTLFAWTVA